MSKKFNNRTLLILLGVLVLLFVFVKFYHSVKTESTLKTNLVEVDTAKITKISIYPTSENRSEIKFYKEGNTWKVSKGKIVADAERNAVGNLFSQILEIKPKSLASRSKNKWPEYHVTDTTATILKVYEGNKLALDMYIGKFTYQRGNNMNSMYGGGGMGTSYVRLAGDDEVYAVNGFLTFTFNQPFSSWRNQTIAKVDKSNVTKLTFKYPGDSSFVASLQNKQWTISGIKADSTKISEYLNSLNYKNGSNFDDNFIPSGNPIYQLTVEGNNMGPLSIQAWPNGESAFVINSSANPKSWFADNNKGIFKEIFKNQKDFFAGTKKK